MPVSDGELLAAVREAGEPGTASHRLACRLYRRSVLEYRQAAAVFLRTRDPEATVAAALRDVAMTVGLCSDVGGPRFPGISAGKRAA